MKSATSPQLRAHAFALYLITIALSLVVLYADAHHKLSFGVNMALSALAVVTFVIALAFTLAARRTRRSELNNDDQSTDNNDLTSDPS